MGRYDRIGVYRVKYIVTSLKLEVLMGMKIRFGKSVVSIASLDYFFPETSGMSSSDIFRSILMNKLAEDFHFTDSKLQFKIKTEALISQKSKNLGALHFDL